VKDVGIRPPNKISWGRLDILDIYRWGRFLAVVTRVIRGRLPVIHWAAECRHPILSYRISILSLSR
jgi:hypothetical protein